MKNVSQAPYIMLALALLGIVVAFYDAHATYNAALTDLTAPRSA